jgi:hypothetical protein
MLLYRLFYLAVVAGAALIVLASASLAHEIHGATPDMQAWYSNVETTLEARKRLPWVKCCNHAEVVRTQFRVNKTDRGDEWYYLAGGAWKRIPPDVIHPHDEHAPDGQPTLFIYQGEETCFFLGEGGI